MKVCVQNSPIRKNNMCMSINVETGKEWHSQGVFSINPVSIVHRIHGGSVGNGSGKYRLNLNYSRPWCHALACHGYP